VYLSDMVDRSRLGALSLALALFVAACGGSGGAANTATPAANTAAAGAPSATRTIASATTAATATPALPTAAIATPVPSAPPTTPPTSAPPTVPPVVDPAGAAPTVVVGAIADAAMQYYDITGTTAGELRSSINGQGPVDSAGRRNDALTMWNIDWTWPLNPDSSCILSGATISTTITVTFPRWQPPAGTSAGLVQQWNTYEEALVTHEGGHVAFILATAPEVLAGIKGATCATAEAAAQAVVGRIRQHDIDYDAETNHGFTQGAHFP
jgi:predicted secreted Zn-dependent protease